MDATQVENLIQTAVKPLEDRTAQLEKEKKEAIDRCVGLEMGQKLATQSARKIQIKQEVYKCKSAGDKRSLSHLLDEQYDLEDFKDELVKIVDEDKDSFEITNENKNKVQSFVKFSIDFANMRSRKNKKEQEDYRIATNSKAGWATTKKFRGDDIFKEDTDKNKPWYESEELSNEQKVERFRKAERYVKFDKSFFRGRGRSFGRPFFSRGDRGYQTRFSRWAPIPPSQSTQLALPLPDSEKQKMFIPSQMQFPPPGFQKLCFNCLMPNHISRNCPNPKKN